MQGRASQYLQANEDGRLKVALQGILFVLGPSKRRANQSVNIPEQRPTHTFRNSMYSRVNRYRLALAGRASITPDLPSPSPQCHASLISLTGAPAPTQMTRGGGVRGTTTLTSCSRVWRSSSRRLAAASSSSLLSRDCDDCPVFLRSLIVNANCSRAKGRVSKFTIHFACFIFLRAL